MQDKDPLLPELKFRALKIPELNRGGVSEERRASGHPGVRI
jgi:hypothetical protein